MSPTPLRIGVMMENVQLSDITCIDVLGNLSAQYVKEVAAAGFVSEEFIPLAPEMEWHFLSTTLEPAFLTPSMKIVPTVTYDDAPRDLDFLIIGGPPPYHRPVAADKFMKEAADKTKIIMTTCIGSLWLASSGVLDGKKATTNRGALQLAKQMYPDVEWQDQRWVTDGKLWTSGGAGAGIDMVATYALENFDKKFVRELALISLDFDPEARGLHYRTETGF